MSIYWNERVKNLDPYTPGEQPRDKKFIKLNTNENPYPPSPKVLEALQKAANGDIRLYPDPECLRLREAAAAAYEVMPEQVFAGNGSDEILAFAFAAFFGSKGELLFPDITYSFYPVYAALWDIPYRTVPTLEDFSVRVEDYLLPSGGVVLPNPNAPTGRALSGEELRSIVEYQGRANRVVLIDEAYVAFGAESLSAFITEYPNLLVVHTLSKSKSLAGLRIGFALGQEELIEGLRRIRDSFNSYTLDRIALAGAEAAMRDGVYYEGVNGRIIATRERCTEVLGRLGFTVLPSKANFLFIKAPGCSGSELFTGLRERGILVRHWNKGRIADYLRVSIGTDDEMDAFLAACGELI